MFCFDNVVNYFCMFDIGHRQPDLQRPRRIAKKGANPSVFLPGGGNVLYFNIRF